MDPPLYKGRTHKDLPPLVKKGGQRDGGPNRRKRGPRANLYPSGTHGKTRHRGQAADRDDGGDRPGGRRAVLAALTDVRPGGLTAYLLIAILSPAMGLRNTIARGIGDPNLATTVLNLTLSAFLSSIPTVIASEREPAPGIAAAAAVVVAAAVSNQGSRSTSTASA
jgi:hypothetical protein